MIEAKHFLWRQEGGVGVITLNRPERKNAINRAVREAMFEVWPRFEADDSAQIAILTGAGDTFAGGFMGYLAAQNEITDDTMRRAMIYGSVMASFNVEKFGTERVDALDYPEINQRFKDFKQMTHFDDIPFERASAA